MKIPLIGVTPLWDDKLPKVPQISKEEAVAKLARTYFRSHGPATLEDFVWWSGLNIGDCRKGLSAIQNELVEERWKGLTFFRHLLAGYPTGRRGRGQLVRRRRQGANRTLP